VFVFTRDHDMLIFRSEDAAASWMEAIDVFNGEYEAIYDVRGTIIDAEAIEPKHGIMALHRTDRSDPEALRRRIQGFLDRTGGHGSADDPQALADEQFRAAWERRWPKRPRWLDQRLHGEPPAHSP
jgi:phage terminase large subunit-like protein